MIKKIVRISSKWQVVLPKEIRQKAQIEQGNYLAIELQDEKIVLKQEKIGPAL
ncbi:AbrB/MazE/SpoVT family DNA-binding domain-containing protein [Thermodesulfatator indicus]